MHQAGGPFLTRKLPTWLNLLPLHLLVIVSPFGPVHVTSQRTPSLPAAGRAMCGA